MKTIPLTQGYVAMVDDRDFEAISKFKWFAKVCPRTVYAVRMSRVGECFPRTLIPMHRAILNTEKGHIDHWDGNGLNNQRRNLRSASRSQNNFNSKLRSDNLSRRKGVHYKRDTGKFVASIWLNGKHKHLGVFYNAETAHAAYQKAAIKHHGDFARFE